MFSVKNYLGTSYDRNLVWVPYYLSDKGFLGLPFVLKAPGAVFTKLIRNYFFHNIFHYMTF